MHHGSHSKKLVVKAAKTCVLIAKEMRGKTAYERRVCRHSEDEVVVENAVWDVNRRFHEAPEEVIYLFLFFFHLDFVFYMLELCEDEEDVKRNQDQKHRPQFNAKPFKGLKSYRVWMFLLNDPGVMFSPVVISLIMIVFSSL